MTTHIKPFLNNNVEEFNWKANPDLDALKNLKTILLMFQMEKTALDKETLPTTHLEKQIRLLRALKESQLNFASVELLLIALKTKKITTLNQKLKNIESSNLEATLTQLYAQKKMRERQKEGLEPNKIQENALLAATLSLVQMAAHSQKKKKV